MRREGCHIEKQRLGSVVVLDDVHRLVSDQSRIVAIFFEELAIPLPIDQSATLSSEIVRLTRGCHRNGLEMVEAAVLRPVFLIGMAKMPFPDQRCLIADVP